MYPMKPYSCYNDRKQEQNNKKTDMLLIRCHSVAHNGSGLCVRVGNSEQSALDKDIQLN
jgi:hypothetical protein